MRPPAGQAAAVPQTPLVSRPAPALTRHGTPLAPAVPRGGTLTQLPRPAADRPPPRVRAAGAAGWDPQGHELRLVTQLSRTLAQAALEVIRGARSIQQLARWLDGNCLRALATRSRLHAEACQAEQHHPGPGALPPSVHILHHQPLVHSCHVGAVAPGVYEAAVVIADGTRFRAIALRLEQRRGLWKVTALQIG